MITVGEGLLVNNTSNNGSDDSLLHTRKVRQTLKGLMLEIIAWVITR